MASTGIRSLRWGLESTLIYKKLKSITSELEIWANDADINAFKTLNQNLSQLENTKISLKIHKENAERLLCNTYLQDKFVDLIDIDSFGCPNYLLQPTFRVLRFNGFLILSNTDARSITGHDRKSGIRKFGALSRVHPASWEIGLRLQISAIAKQASIIGRGIKPLVSYSDGRSFRICIQFKKNVENNSENKIGFIVRCDKCGDQAAIPLYDFKDWDVCNCMKKSGHRIINVPLWIGEIQCPIYLQELINIADIGEIPVAKKTKTFLKKAKKDPGLPSCCWSISELASKLSLTKPPKTQLLTKALQSMGYIGLSSSIMPGQIRTDAPFKELCKICASTIAKQD